MVLSTFLSSTSSATYFTLSIDSFSYFSRRLSASAFHFIISKFAFSNSAFSLEISVRLGPSLLLVLLWTFTDFTFLSIFFFIFDWRGRQAAKSGIRQLPRFSSNLLQGSSRRAFRWFGFLDGRGSCPESKQISSLFSKRQAGSKIWYQAVASIFSKSLLRIFSKSSLVVWLLGWTWQLSRVQTNFFSFLKKAGRRQNLVSGSCLDFL